MPGVESGIATRTTGADVHFTGRTALMEPSVMVHKANQIAIFFASYPREEAVAGFADHLQKFWEPRMRRQIIQYVHDGGVGLHEIIPDGVSRLK